jgi:hypothetical protein
VKAGLLVLELNTADTCKLRLLLLHLLLLLRRHGRTLLQREKTGLRHGAPAAA